MAEGDGLLAERRNYISRDDMQAFDALSAEVGRLAHGLERSLEAAIAAEASFQPAPAIRSSPRANPGPV